jgi:hypothetical protein
VSNGVPWLRAEQGPVQGIRAYLTLTGVHTSLRGRTITLSWHSSATCQMAHLAGGQYGPDRRVL